jgi:hypothetical protein
MPAASVVLGLVLVAAPAAYCTGQPITSESGVPRYPNGQAWSTASARSTTRTARG